MNDEEEGKLEVRPFVGGMITGIGVVGIIAYLIIKFRHTS